MRKLVEYVGVRSLHSYSGAVLVAVGASLVYPPAGLVVLGAFLAYLGTWHRRA